MIALNKILAEIYDSSPGAQKKLESLYPVSCNISILGLSTFSLNLNSRHQDLNFFEAPDPQFSLNLSENDFFEIIKNRKTSYRSIAGDSELALIFLGTLAETKVDFEILIYKNFGTLPALAFRHMMNPSASNKPDTKETESLISLRESLRNTSIRLDRLEQIVSQQ